jgi:hypothetical protein
MPHRSGQLTISGVALGHRVHSAFARDRLGQALHEVALDVLHPSPTLGAAERDWLRDALARPIHIATEAALGTFAAELEQALRGHVAAPPPEEAVDD